MLLRLGRLTLMWRWTRAAILLAALASQSCLATDATNSDDPEAEIMRVLEQTDLAVAKPEEGEIVGPNPHVHVNLFTSDADAFTKAFNGSYLCLRLDDLPYSCWPIAFARMKLAGLPEGHHEITAVLLHPRTHEVVKRSDMRLFRSHPTPDSLKPPVPPAPSQDLPKLEAPQDAAVPVAPELVSIDVPLVMVTHPVELSGTGPEFHVITDLHVSNMTLFRHLFANDFVCLSLDNAPSSCWPLSQSDVRPLFVNVPDGLHTLVASLTHPTEGRIIQETKSQKRSFFSLESFEDTPSTAVDVPRRDESLTVLQTGPGKPAQEETRSTTPEAPASGASVSKRFSARRLEPAVMLEVEVDGRAVSLVFHSRSNRTQVAQDFCTTHTGGGDEECISSIVSLLDANANQLSTPLVVQ